MLACISWSLQVGRLCCESRMIKENLSFILIEILIQGTTGCQVYKIS